ncbi:MAG: GNAT family N-acetyltransferase [Hyphomicrobiaceae bacterium]|nr:GNAT family N-acetyltransferase [Hyphomicrobiaceae bacterium]
MAELLNALGQPIGRPLPGWTQPPRPSREPMEGRWCQLVPLDPAAHGAALFQANSLDVEGRNWTYMGYGPFATQADYMAWLESVAGKDDPFYLTIIDTRSGEPVGVATYMRIDPPNGVIEVGNINYSPRLQRTPAATEAMYLMMARAFALGYRRYEWKCDSLNTPSWRAAERLGFRFEGIFRQAVIYKGRNRDTAWLSVIDSEWPLLEAAFKAWLDPANFDASGAQRRGLRALREQT